MQTASVHKRDYLALGAGAFRALLVVALALARPCDQVENEQMSDALRERLGYEHPVLRGRGDGVRERKGRLAHLVDEDGLVMLAGKLDAGEEQRIVDPGVDL